MSVRAEHHHPSCPPPLTEADTRRTRLAGGGATLLSSHAGHPRPATSDTTKGSQTRPGRQPQRESARRPVGTFSSASDVTDEPESKQQASKQQHYARRSAKATPLLPFAYCDRATMASSDSVSLRQLAWPAVVIASSLCIAIALRLPAFDMPLNRDESLYATVGWFGGFFDVLPYADIFDHKQPLIYSVYWLLDVLAPLKLGAIRLAAALSSGLAAAALILDSRSMDRPPPSAHRRGASSWSRRHPSWWRAPTSTRSTCSYSPARCPSSTLSRGRARLALGARRLRSAVRAGDADQGCSRIRDSRCCASAFSRCRRARTLAAPGSWGCSPPGRSPFRSPWLWRTRMVGALDDLWYANYTFNRLALMPFHDGFCRPAARRS